MYYPSPKPLPHKITGLRGRNKAADLATVARLWLSDAHVRAHLGDVTFKACVALDLEQPPTWERKRWNRIERYVSDLVQAVPAHLYGLIAER